MTIAAVLVVRNEAHRIAETLTALSPHVDEIVVVDQESDDGTFALALPLSDKTTTDRCWGFSEPSRELGEKHVDSDWIILLDADEALSTRFAAEMRELAMDPDVDMYALARSTYLDGWLWLTEPTVNRFYRRGTAIHHEGLHTTVQPRDASRRRVIPYRCIEHRKTWDEQHADDARYKALTAAG